MRKEIGESEVRTGVWYNADNYNLPIEKYYDTGEPPKYMYLYMQKICCDGGNEYYYWNDDTLPYGIDTFLRLHDWKYWMAIPKYPEHTECCETENNI